MASFTKRSGKWHVRIRRKGYPIQCGVFDTKREAEDWAGGVESQMSKRLHIVDKRSHVLTLGQVVEAYTAASYFGRKRTWMSTVPEDVQG